MYTPYSDAPHDSDTISHAPPLIPSPCLCIQQLLEPLTFDLYPYYHRAFFLPSSTLIFTFLSAASVQNIYITVTIQNQQVLYINFYVSSLSCVAFCLS